MKNIYYLLGLVLLLNREAIAQRNLSEYPVFNHTFYSSEDQEVIESSNHFFIRWSSIPWAKEYHLEWTFISTEGVTESNKFTFNFRHNSTRIVTKNTYYQLPAIFERGYILLRIRAVDIDNQGKYFYGRWDWRDDSGEFDFAGSVPPNVLHSSTFDSTGKYTWQLVSTFGEEGKRKDVIMYLDGTGREHQTQTRINSTAEVIVGETYYDQAGRPAVKSMPSPSQTKSLNFKQRFNLNTSNEPYSHRDFDVGGNAIPMSPSSGAEYYFSRPQGGDYATLVPKSEGFPFSQTEYTPDNTGRISRQGGVGPKFQLDNGHETRYFYDTPSQTELDRLFGNDAGYSEHYQRQTIIDPNGQVQIQYTNLSGKTVLTGMRGDTPANLDSITTYVWRDPLQDNLLNSSSTDVNKLYAAKNFIVTIPQSYSFKYELDSLHFNYNACRSTCQDCVYDLSILLKNQQGDTLWDRTATVGQMDTCTAFFFADSLTTLRLEKGEYTVSRTLSVNENAVQAYVIRQLKVDSLCLDERYRDIAEEERIPNVGCLTCNEACKDSLMKNLNPCEMALSLLKSDMSPGGQYATYDWLNKSESDLTKLDIKNRATSYFNLIPNNFKLLIPHLHSGDILGSSASTVMAWRKPIKWDKITGRISGYGDYLNEDGTEAYVEVTDSSNVFNFWELVEGVGKKTLGNKMYVKPKHLKREAFIAAWQPFFADALVPYHPEFCYYRACLSENTELTNSQSFISKMTETQTWEEAVQRGLLIKNGTKFTIAKDPYFTPHTDLLDTYGDSLRNYKRLGSNYLSVYQITYGAVICGVRYVQPRDVEDCMSSVPNSYISPTSNPLINDRLWNTLKGIVMGIVTKIKENNQEKYIVQEGCRRNDCIGDEPNDALKPLLSQAPIHIIIGEDITYPDTYCSGEFYEFYEYKTRRFPKSNMYDGIVPKDLADHLLAKSYIECGKCPIVTDLEGLLNQINNGKLLLRDFDIFDHLALSQNIRDVFVSVAGLATSRDRLDFRWKLQSQSSQEVVFKILSKSNEICTLNLKNTDTADIINWQNIHTFSCFEYQPRSNSKYSFRVIAQTRDDKRYILEGSTSCFNLKECTIPKVCTITQQGYEIVSKLDTILKVKSLGNCKFDIVSNCQNIDFTKPYSITHIAVGNEPNKLQLMIHQEYKDEKFNCTITIISKSKDCFQFSNCDPYKAKTCPNLAYNGTFDDGSLPGASQEYLASINQNQQLRARVLVNRTQGIWSQTLSSGFAEIYTFSVRVKQLNNPAGFPFVNLYESIPVNIPTQLFYLKIEQLNPPFRVVRVSLNQTGNGDFKRLMANFPVAKLSTYRITIACRTNIPVPQAYTNRLTTNWLVDDIIIGKKDCNACCTLFPPPIIVQNNCQRELEIIATENTTRRFDNYLGALKDSLRTAFINHCLRAREQFTMHYTDKLYNVTLFYYDAAGNLTKTVPPAGVQPLANMQVTGVQQARNNINLTPGYPDHQFTTTYQYTSLNQITKTKTPDTDTKRIWYDALGRVVLSQTGRQVSINQYHYVLYDNLNRKIESGLVSLNKVQKDSILKSVNPRIWIDSSIIANSKREITTIQYDRPLVSTIAGADIDINAYRNNARGRIATTTYRLMPNSLNHATYYVYDIHGYVKTLVQQNPTMADQSLKKIDYSYDLISGKVNQVAYQKGKYDAFYHRFYYDADNRLDSVSTSLNGTVWQRDARYQYYQYGPLARETLGNNLQRKDYTYTLQGWLKGINANQNNPRYGERIDYYEGDYKPVSNGPLPMTSLVATSTPDLFNGNIKSITYANAGLPTEQKLSYAYRYDQLNRLTKMDAWGVGASTPKDAYAMRLAYDPNGNIIQLLRNGTASRLAMDSLSYHYRDTTNLLTHVTDPISNSNYPGDIDNQNDNNYDYDLDGNLTQDLSESIRAISWNGFGKVAQIEKNANEIIRFDYDELGRRISKSHTKLLLDPARGNVRPQTTTTYYVLDAAGQPMAFYVKKDTNPLIWESSPIYGTSRLGVYQASTAITPTEFTKKKEYELTDHLGNVMATIKDSVGIRFVTAQDYYPFGMPMPERSLSPNYRFGYNGMEKDNEAKGNGNEYATEFRQYDARLGRWLGMDPLANQYASKSPFMAMGNNPITRIDNSGMDDEMSHMGEEDATSETSIEGYEDKISTPSLKENNSLAVKAKSNFSKNKFLETGNNFAENVFEFVKPSEEEVVMFGSGVTASFGDGPLPFGEVFLGSVILKYGGTRAVKAANILLKSFDDDVIDAVEFAASKTSRGLWKLTKEGASAIKYHKTFGTIYKSSSDGLWWVADKADHGGSKFKVYKEGKKGLEWFKDADEFGDFIVDKHKGPTGTFIPWGQLGTVKNENIR